ncbi:hypothetical protein J437_LFUL015782 [Ladona fulva]|uniref:Chitin-binding type-2 domain-containing protein n=1 Tax=Ladona fulva TaxID=123851 RepID=A0A8K0P7S2_LADFU|nr:hypothetical protein J437_LFUL015782 [Ladona fulva]
MVIGRASSQRRPPNYSLDDMPETSFDCSDKIEGGYYADPEADCQMFHVCVRMPGNDVQDYRFLCPNDTMFDQENRICANWFDIDCEAAAVYYGNSFDLYRIGASGNVDQRLTEIVASPAPIISLGPSTARPLGGNRPRTSGTGFYSSRRNGPRNNFETNSADDESLVRSATGDRRLQRTEEETSSEGESYDEAPKRRPANKKKVALRKLNRNRGNENFDGSFTKSETTYQSTSKSYISSPSTERPNFRGSNNYNGFPRNGGTNQVSVEPPANTQQFNNDYRSQQGGNNAQKQYKTQSTVPAGTTYRAPSPTSTASPFPSSFSGNYQNYQRPPSRPSVPPTPAPETYPSPTTFSPSTQQNNNFNTGFVRNGNNYDRTNPVPTTYAPSTQRQNNYNAFNGNNFQNANPAPTTYSPPTSKSTNYNPYTANFNSNYNSQTTTTVAPSASDYSSFRTASFQRNNFNSFSTIAPTTTQQTTTVAPTSRRQPYNNRRSFQSPAPFQLEEDESLKTAQSANFGSNDDYVGSNTFRGVGNKAQNNYTKAYYTTAAPSQNDRANNRYQGGNTESTAAYTGRSTFRFSPSNNGQSSFSASPSTTSAPVTRGSSNFRSGNTYSQPIPSGPSSQSIPKAPSTRVNDAFTNRSPVTTVTPQNTIANVNNHARGNRPVAPEKPQPQAPVPAVQQKGSEAYDYAYYDDSGATYDYEGFEAEAEAHFGKTKKGSRVTPPVPGN